MQKYLFYLTYLFVILTWSCKGDDNFLKAIQVTPENIELATGSSLQVKAEPFPTNIDSQEMPFLWESNNPDVATVTPSGNFVTVKGISAGTAEITVKARVSTGINKKIPVKVIDNTIPLTGIKVVPENLILEIEQSAQITAIPEPNNASNITFSWESDDTDIATVSASGLVTGKAKGTTTITVKSGNIEKKIPLTVTHTLRIVMGNTTYEVDTLDFQTLDEGINFFKFSIPEFTNGIGKGLVVHSVEVDLTYPDNKIEVWAAKMSGIDNRETPGKAFSRIKNEIDGLARKPVAITNGDFYVLDANIPVADYGYIKRRPHGMEAINGMIIQTPFKDILGHTHVEALIIRDNGAPDYVPKISFTGSVKAGDDTYALSEINSFADEGELVLFNNMSYIYDQYSTGLNTALAWSPYVSTMISLSEPEGGWKVNEPMKFKVTEIEHDVKTEIPVKAPYGGKQFNGEGAILVGNPTNPALNNASKLFLSKLNVDDEIEITTEIKNNGNNIEDKKLSVIGIDARGAMLLNGIVNNTWNEAHPRTVVGYSEDQKKAFLIVIDGRQSTYSAGVTTGQAGEILKALGAHYGVNLDGGGSSAMVVNGSVVNKPSDGSERAVSNGIFVVTKK